jgi:hypothetical protein
MASLVPPSLVFFVFVFGDEMVIGSGVFRREYEIKLNEKPNKM